MTRVRTNYVPLRGGLDLITPLGQADPGRASDMRNFEVTLAGAYRRIDGYERFDGRPAPHQGLPEEDAATPIDLIAEGMGDGTSYAVSDVGERLVTPAVLRIPLQGIDLDLGQSFDYEYQFAFSIHQNPVYHYLVGDYPNATALLLAIEDLPGIVSAVWDQAPVGGELVITSEIEPVNGGDPALEVIAAYFRDQTLLQDTTESRRALIQAPPGEGPILGIAVFQGVVIVARDNGGNSFLYVSDAGGWTGLTLPATRLGGANYQFAKGNFTGNPGDQSLYVVDGLNPPLEIKGPNLVTTEITDCNTVVGALTLYPRLVEVHKGHLVVGYEAGSVQWSAIGDPFNWAVAGGAGEIAVGEELSDIKVLKDDALGVFTKDSIKIIYGDSAANWSVDTMGTNQSGVEVIPGTVQHLGEPLFADEFGVRSLQATDAYGNFAMTTATLPVRPIYAAMRTGIKCSAVLRGKNQYRLFGDGGQVLVLTGNASNLIGISYSKLPVTATCAASGDDDGAGEIVVIGTDAGMVYQLDVGDTFDGAPIDAALQLHFNHLGAPRHHKRWRKAVFDMFAPVPFDMNANLIFNYGGQDHAQHIQAVTDISGGYGLWNVDAWGTFRWGGQYMSEGEIDITGSGRTLSVLLHCEGKFPAFELYGVSYHYSVRRLQRE